MTTDEAAVGDEAGTSAAMGTRPRTGRRRAEKQPGRVAESLGARPEGQPSWWHRGHPVFVPLSGFFTGLLLVIVVPGALGAVLGSLFDRETAAHLLPFGLAVFVVPLGLIAAPRTRRFGLYLLLGMLVTAIVVVGVGVATLLFLFSRDS